MNSSTVALIALVISALEVYGKQIFRTALQFEVSNPYGKGLFWLDILLIMLGHFHGSVDKGEDVVGNEVSLAKHTNTCAVSIKQFSMLYELLQFHFSHGHQPFDLATWSVEVLDTEGVDCHYFDTGLVADLEHLGRESD